MGNWFSSPNSSKKTIDADGEVNNNVVIQGGDVNIEFTTMILVAIICAIKVFEILRFAYTRHKRMIKENYERDNKLNDKNGV